MRVDPFRGRSELRRLSYAWEGIPGAVHLGPVRICRARVGDCVDHEPVCDVVARQRPVVDSTAGAEILQKDVGRSLEVLSADRLNELVGLRVDAGVVDRAWCSSPRFSAVRKFDWCASASRPRPRGRAGALSNVDAPWFGVAKAMKSSTKAPAGNHLIKASSPPWLCPITSMFSPVISCITSTARATYSEAVWMSPKARSGNCTQQTS